MWSRLGSHHFSAQIDEEIAIDALLLYGKPTTQRKKAIDWKKFVILVN